MTLTPDKNLKSVSLKDLQTEPALKMPYFKKKCMFICILPTVVMVMTAHQNEIGIEVKLVSSSSFSAKKIRLANTRTPRDIKSTSKPSSL